jgi:hypothetical protein
MRIRAWLTVLGLGLCASSLGERAEAQPAASTTENVTLAPIQCWTRTSTNGVHVGELFTLVLTCAVVETQSTTVVPDQSRLDPGALQVPPFEVVSGTQAPDLRTRTHRYFQYEYVLRFLGEQIGGDVELPGPTINYRVQSRVQGDSAVEGRDRQYVMPPARVRVTSLVPAAAAGIHDEAPETFRAIAGRRFRANLLRIVSWVLFGVGALLVAYALAALVRRPKAAAAAQRRLAPESAVLRAVRRELDDVRRQRQGEGWNGDLAARALAALRIAGTYALGRAVAQAPDGAGSPPLVGQLRVSSFWPARRAARVSGSATAEALATVATAGADLEVGPYENLRVALERFAAAAYGRNGIASAADLDEALELGERGVHDVARNYTWRARAGRAIRHSVIGMRDKAWAR